MAGPKYEYPKLYRVAPHNPHPGHNTKIHINILKTQQAEVYILSTKQKTVHLNPQFE